MRSSRRTFGNAGSIWVTLGAVLYGCAFLLPAAGGAATITVDIIKPTTGPTYTFDTGQEYEFEAVAFVEGEELPGGEVSWEWDFGDNTDHVLTNPATHTFARCGNFVITVTARYGNLTGQDTINATAATAGLLDSVEFLVLPDTGGRVCDGVEVMLRIPEQELERHNAILGLVSFYRGPLWHLELSTMDQQSRYMDGTAYRTVSTWWNTPGDPNTAAVDWQVDYTLWVLEPPPAGQQAPYYATVLGSKANSWTPYNLVITAGGPLVIEHHKGDESHTLSWQAAHLEDDEGVIPKTYTAAVQVLDKSGNLVVSSPWLPYTINQPASWEWEPGVPPEGDADGLYAFRVIADHSPEDSDCDKVDMLSEVGLPTPGDAIQIDWDTLTLKGKIEYTASGELASPILHIKGPSETQISLPTEAGHHEIEFDNLPIGYGVFTAYITAMQTEEQGAANRDGIPKPVIPEGCNLGSIPGPPGSVEIAEPDLEPLTDNHVAFDGGDPGECAFAATGIVKDAEGKRLSGMEPGLAWAIEPISGSILTTIPDPAKGFNPAFTYTALPSSNGEFGAKSVTLTHPLVTSSDTQDVELFFSLDADNHPDREWGTRSNHVENSPNWYYYWCQTSANYGSHYYWSGGGGSHVAISGPDDGIAFIGAGACDRAAGGCWDGATGIDFFANICRHEERHRLDYHELWPLGYLQGLSVDSDGDLIPDDRESPNAMHDLNPGYPYYAGIWGSYIDWDFGYNPTPGEPLRDIEHYCLTRQEPWTNGQADDEDWAAPGKQWSH